MVNAIKENKMKKDQIVREIQSLNEKDRREILRGLQQKIDEKKSWVGSDGRTYKCWKGKKGGLVLDGVRTTHGNNSFPITLQVDEWERLLENAAPNMKIILSEYRAHEQHKPICRIQTRNHRRQRCYRRDCKNRTLMNWANDDENRIIEFEGRIFRISPYLAEERKKNVGSNLSTSWEEEDANGNIYRMVHELDSKQPSKIKYIGRYSSYSQALESILNYLVKEKQ